MVHYRMMMSINHRLAGRIAVFNMSNTHIVYNDTIVSKTEQEQTTKKYTIESPLLIALSMNNQIRS